MEAKKTTNELSPEIGARAVRMVQEHQGEYASQWAAITSIASQTEGAKFWLKVVNELKTRGVNGILIAVVDGLEDFPEAITTVFPQTLVQTCIVHLIRNSLAFVSWKDRKAIMPSLKAIYRAEAADIALTRLEEFEAV